MNLMTVHLPRERLRQQDLYADRDSAGDKALVMKQFLSDEKVDYLATIIRLFDYKAMIIKLFGDYHWIVWPI